MANGTALICEDLEWIGEQPREAADRLAVPVLVEAEEEWDEEWVDHVRRQLLYDEELPLVKNAIALFARLRRRADELDAARSFLINPALLTNAFACASWGWLSKEETRRLARIRLLVGGVWSGDEDDEFLYAKMEADDYSEYDIVAATHRELILKRIDTDPCSRRNEHHDNHLNRRDHRDRRRNQRRRLLRADLIARNRVEHFLAALHAEDAAA